MLRRETGSVAYKHGKIWFGPMVRARDRSWRLKYTGVLLQAPEGHPMPIGRVVENWNQRTSPWYMQNNLFGVGPRVGPRVYAHNWKTRTPSAVGRAWWYYINVVYWTDDLSLHSGDIKALLDQRLTRGRAALESAKGTQAGKPAPKPRAGIPKQIRELGELRDRGLITPEEFESKKTELLGRM